jgi:hypothetical protein
MTTKDKEGQATTFPFLKIGLITLVLVVILGLVLLKAFKSEVESQITHTMGDDYPADDKQ